MLRFAKVIVMGLFVLSLGCSGTPINQSTGLEGSGSTFVYPLMITWASKYEKEKDGCKVNYHSLGSENGIKGIINRKVEFGCTDGPMTEQELEAAQSAGGEVFHIPLVLGAVVPVYNLAEIKQPLNFTGEVLADIYLGKIKKWNDEALRKLNPDLNLPDKEIVTVHRRDGSGTTAIWTDFLAKVSPAWKKEVGSGTEVSWPGGQAEVGNEGVAKYVKGMPDSIGYVELSHAYRFDLSFGFVGNREGKFVKANATSVKAAAANGLADIPADLRYSLTNAPGKDSYPIAGTTWAILYSHQSGEKGKQLVEFLNWTLSEGQESAEELFYVRLPEVLSSRAKDKLEHVEIVR
jgi:phosphate transport system substrate-binding protein